MRAVTLELKPAGSWYAVVLRRGFSGAKLFATGALGLSSDFPMPELGTRCVCCDVENSELVNYDPNTGRVRQTTFVPVPICRMCRPHVERNTGNAQLLAAALCGGFGLALWAAMKAAWLLAGIGGAIMAGCVVYIVNARTKLRALDATGHHAGLEISAHAGQCVVRTTNRRVAAELAERHADCLHRVR